MAGTTGWAQLVVDHPAVQVRVSFLEVYNEEVRDLLSKQTLNKALEVREHRSSRIYVKGLTAIVVKSASEMERVFEVRSHSHGCLPQGSNQRR